jgi:hypothetical protein
MIRLIQHPLIQFVRQIFFLTVASAILFSCQKSTSPKHPPRIVSDTLMVYNQQLANGKINIYYMSFKTGEVNNIIFNGNYPFATNNSQLIFAVYD